MEVAAVLERLGPAIGGDGFDVGGIAQRQCAGERGKASASMPATLARPSRLREPLLAAAHAYCEHDG